jgi:phosphate/sulfate permease
MSEAEILQHFWSSIENGISSFMMYITVFSGYLLMAYVVGSRLTSAQCVIVTGAFLVFCGYVLWGSFVYYTSAYMAAKQLVDSHPHFLPIDLNPAYVVSVLLSTGALAALKFMWDVRHPKTD